MMSNYIGWFVLFALGVLALLETCLPGNCNALERTSSDSQLEYDNLLGRQQDATSPKQAPRARRSTVVDENESSRRAEGPQEEEEDRNNEQVNEIFATTSNQQEQQISIPAANPSFEAAFQVDGYSCTRLPRVSPSSVSEPPNATASDSDSEAAPRALVVRQRTGTLAPAARTLVNKPSKQQPRTVTDETEPGEMEPARDRPEPGENHWNTIATNWLDGASSSLSAPPGGGTNASRLPAPLPEDKRKLADELAGGEAVPATTTAPPPTRLEPSSVRRHGGPQWFNSEMRPVRGPGESLVISKSERPGQRQQLAGEQQTTMARPGGPQVETASAGPGPGPSADNAGQPGDRDDRGDDGDEGDMEKMDQEEEEEAEEEEQEDDEENNDNKSTEMSKDQHHQTGPLETSDPSSEGAQFATSAATDTNAFSLKLKYDLGDTVTETNTNQANEPHQEPALARLSVDQLRSHGPSEQEIDSVASWPADSRLAGHPETSVDTAGDQDQAELDDIDPDIRSIILANDRLVSQLEHQIVGDIIDDDRLHGPAHRDNTTNEHQAPVGAPSPQSDESGTVGELVAHGSRIIPLFGQHHGKVARVVGWQGRVDYDLSLLEGLVAKTMLMSHEAAKLGSKKREEEHEQDNRLVSDGYSIDQATGSPPQEHDAARQEPVAEDEAGDVLESGSKLAHANDQSFREQRQRRLATFARPSPALQSQRQLHYEPDSDRGRKRTHEFDDENGDDDDDDLVRYQASRDSSYWERKNSNGGAQVTTWPRGTSESPGEEAEKVPGIKSSENSAQESPLISDSRAGRMANTASGPAKSDRLHSSGPARIYESCSEMPDCEWGGECTVDRLVTDARGRLVRRQARCRCPINRGGQFCQKPIQRVVPRFLGQSYLALPMASGAYLTSLRLLFKPEMNATTRLANDWSPRMRQSQHHETTSLLLYSSKFAILLDSSDRIEFRYLQADDQHPSDGGAVSNSITHAITRVFGSRDVLLNEWNELIVTDASSDDTLEVEIEDSEDNSDEEQQRLDDRGDRALRRTTSGPVNQIVVVTPDKIESIAPNMSDQHSDSKPTATSSQLFLGGLPHASKPKSPQKRLKRRPAAMEHRISWQDNHWLGQPNHFDIKGLSGCIKEFEMNGRIYNLGSDLSGDTLDGFDLAGHKNCFKLGTRPNTILKRATGNEEQCLNRLQQDQHLAPFVPKIYGTIQQDGKLYLELQDLLAGFHQASVMDIKMGYRTYREEELYSALEETSLRQDMFDKMIEVDESEPTDEERRVRAITKPRYMIWRESVSSTASLGFRIEGMRLRDGTIDKDFKIIRQEEHIARALVRYAKNSNIRFNYLSRLCELRRALLKSNFFTTHELIGSSLLFVHDDSEANIWLIDFAKTYQLPDNAQVNHVNKWELGNHEDGYLAGIDNLIRIFQSTIPQKFNNFKLIEK